MRILNLTTRLSLKAFSIVLAFMLFFSLYHQWIAFEEKIAMQTRVMEKFTAHIENTLPVGYLLKTEENQGVAVTSQQEQVLPIQDKLQPALNNIFIPSYVVKFGIYSTRLQRIVAIGPELDKSLLAIDDPQLFGELFQADTVKIGRQDHSVLWYGAQVLYFVRPIRYEGTIVGYIFACDNLDRVKADVLHTYEKTLLGTLIALIIAIILFQEIFIRFKRELALFADAIVDGHGRHFQSTIAELNPILQYISTQTEHMARLDRLNIIGEMAASIGHEVRNPLTTVRGFLQYIGNKQAFENYKSHFLLMIDELDRANGIITDFLSLAKNKMMNFKESDLNSIIREVSPLLEADALRYKCLLELELQPDIPALILDAGSLRQVILNIVRNGIEAMPQGGKIKIRTYSDHSAVFLTFADEGTGVPPEIIDKLGTPFFTTKENGTGLGLAVCYRIIQRHNARVTVNSPPGEGTQFTITFSREAHPDNEVGK